MARVLSGVQPTGEMHVGGYLGAFRQWASDQHRHDSFYCIVDLHALTVEHDPARLAALTLEAAAVLLAIGLEPDACTLFVQSHVSEHTELAWLLECTASFGELRRMTQFKDKGGEQGSASAGLFVYPVLMAADILIYDAERVPVGDDQRQHLELARDLAERFNSRYGETLVVPGASVPSVGARVMDLQEPTRKMSKTSASPQGTILVLDEPADIERKVRRAVTDTGGEVSYDPQQKPGVSNLVSLLAACTDRSPAEVAASYSRYGPLKDDVAAALVETLAPVRKRYAEVSGDLGEVAAILEKGAAKAATVASVTLERARSAVGLLPRGFSPRQRP